MTEDQKPIDESQIKFAFCCNRSMVSTNLIKGVNKYCMTCGNQTTQENAPEWRIPTEQERLQECIDAQDFMAKTARCWPDGLMYMGQTEKPSADQRAESDRIFEALSQGFGAVV